MNVLGVHIQSNLSFRDQVDHLVRQSAQTMYALRILRHHGLCGPPLWEVAGATLMSRLTYASSAWWGFIDAERRKRPNSVVIKATKYGYLPPSQPSFDDICMRIDLKFFRSVLSNPHHCLKKPPDSYCMPSLSAGWTIVTLCSLDFHPNPLGISR